MRIILYDVNTYSCCKLYLYFSERKDIFGISLSFRFFALYLNWNIFKITSLFFSGNFCDKLCSQPKVILHRIHHHFQYIFRLLSQNCQLKRLLGQTQHVMETDEVDSGPAPKRRLIDTGQKLLFEVNIQWLLYKYYLGVCFGGENIFQRFCIFDTCCLKKLIICISFGI